MNITFSSIRQLVTGEWVFAWVDTGADFYRIILHGHEIANTNLNTYTFNLPISNNSNLPPPIEVVAERNLAVSELNLPYMILQWYGSIGAVSYRIYELQGVSWVLKETFANQPQFLYTFVTSLLSDEEAHKFRIVAVNEAGMESTPLAFSYKVVRPPLPVSLSYSYSPSTGKLSFST